MLVVKLNNNNFLEVNDKTIEGMAKIVLENAKMKYFFKGTMRS